MTWQTEFEALIEETMAYAARAAGATVKPVVPLKLVEQALAESPRSARLEPMQWPSMGSERDEIKRRVASFKAVQDRMQREREDYCARTLGETRQSIK